MAIKQLDPKAILNNVHTIALIGASDRIDRPSYEVMVFLIEQGYKVLPVNARLAGQMILEQKVYASLQDIKEQIDMVDIFRRSDALEEVVKEAVRLKPLPKVIWFQLGLYNEAAMRLANDAGVDIIVNCCPKIELMS